MRAAPLALLLVSALWGTTFVAVKTGLDDASPLLFVALRFGVATLATLPMLRGRRDLGPSLAAGAPLGVVLAAGYASQTLGLEVTTPSRSAFVTAMNVALVPVWGAILLKKRPPVVSVIGLAITVPGLWLLTAPGGGGWNDGDSWTLVCALSFALHVVLLNRVAPGKDPAGLLVSQLAVTTVLCAAAVPLAEEARLVATPALIGAVLLTGLLATVGTTWLQIRFQPRVDPTRAALIYVTEPVFAAAFSWMFTGELFPAIAWAGAGLMLVGMVLSELGSGGDGDPAGSPLAPEPEVGERDAPRPGEG